MKSYPANTQNITRYSKCNAFPYLSVHINLNCWVQTHSFWCGLFDCLSWLLVRVYTIQSTRASLRLESPATRLVVDELFTMSANKIITFHIFCENDNLFRGKHVKILQGSLHYHLAGLRKCHITGALRERRLHRWPARKGSVMRKAHPCHDVFMYSWSLIPGHRSINNYSAL